MLINSCVNKNREEQEHTTCIFLIDFKNICFGNIYVFSLIFVSSKYGFKKYVL